MQAERFPNTPERKTHNALDELRRTLDMNQKPLASLLEDLDELGVQAITGIKNLEDTRQLILAQISSISSAAETVDSSLETIRVAVDPLVEPLRRKVVKQTILTDEEKQAVEKTLTHTVGLREFFSEHDVDSENATREYLTRVLQLTIYSNDYYENGQKYTLDAVLLSDELISIIGAIGIEVHPELLETLSTNGSEHALRKALDDQINIFEEELKAHFPDEFSDESDYEETEQRTLEEQLEFLDSELWIVCGSRKEEEVLLEVWEAMDNTDRRYIMEGTDGNAALIIARNLGTLVNSDIEKSARHLKEAIARAGEEFQYE